MPAPTLILSAALALATSVGFLAVGALVAGRPRGGPSSLASLSFAAFWASAAILSGTHAVLASVAWLGLESMELVVAIDQMTTPFYCIAGGTLLYYMVFLLTGRSFALPIGTYYLMIFPVVRYHTARADPVGYVVNDWQVNYVYAQPIETWGYTLTIALAAGPVLAAILAYATLARHPLDVATRYRVVCVSVGLAIAVSLETLTFTTDLSATRIGEIARRTVGFLAASIIVAGYIPPRWVKRRWGAPGEAARA